MHPHRMHQEELEEERRRAKDDVSGRPSTSDQGLEASTDPPPNKQPKLAFGVSQNKVSQLICEFVIDSVQPFTLVEEPSFKRLIEGISLGRKSMSTLVSRIEKEFVEVKQTLQ